MSDAERASGLADHLEGYYANTYDAVRDSFAAYPNVRLIKGMVPGTLASVTAERIAYLSIDMNAEVPEVAAMEAFWDRLSPGAFVLMDDYGWTPCINQKLALDAFAARKGVAILALSRAARACSSAPSVLLRGREKSLDERRHILDDAARRERMLGLNARAVSIAGTTVAGAPAATSISTGDRAANRLDQRTMAYVIPGGNVVDSIARRGGNP